MAAAMNLRGFSARPDVFLSIEQEAKSGLGEDSHCSAFGENAGLLAVFDGCGGLGAQCHAEFSGHSEAYMASRLCAGAFYDAFDELTEAETPVDAFLPRAAERTMQTLSANRPKNSDMIRGSMVKTLPTTVAAAFVQPLEGGHRLDAVWAGDSRVYILTPLGLAQLTQDDTTAPDPMENLYEDGVLRNVLCADKPPKLGRAALRVQTSFVAIAATDGCFGYFSTPMEFEGALLETLSEAADPSDWENRLKARIGAVAGDDFTLLLAAYGYAGFAELQNAFAARLAVLKRDYLEALSALAVSDLSARRALWQTYRQTYLRYRKGG